MWKDLSIREKAARTTQQTFNFGIVLTGLLMTVTCHNQFKLIPYAHNQGRVE
jgi:hypothetical protein